MTTSAAHALEPRAAPSSAPVAPAVPQSPPEPAAPDPVPATPVPVPGFGPLDATALDGGAMVVWARHDVEAEKSELLAARLDDRGAPTGPPRLLRRTSGEVLAVATGRRDGEAWIAWLSLLASDPRPRGLLAAMRVAADLSTTTPPVTLHQFTSEQLSLGAGGVELRVLALPGGTAAVGAGGGATECADIVDGRRTTCPGFDLFWVRPDGTFTRAGHFGTDGGDPELGTLVDVGVGVVFDVWAWHGGPTFASLFARHGQEASESPVPLVTCRPPFVRTATGSELVTLCSGDYAAEGERCVVDGVPAEEGACDRIHVVRLDRPAPAKEQRMPPLTSRQRRCHDGHPVLDVAWKGGQRRLDPQHLDAARDLDLGVWTGRHALFIASDGKGERWRCAPGGHFVADGTLDLTPLLAAPAQAERPASMPPGAN